MTLREGSRDRAHGRLALSGSSASIVGEGPLGRRGSWLLSARKSYLDLLIKQVSDDDNFAFGFSDLAGKLAWDLTREPETGCVGGRRALEAERQPAARRREQSARRRGMTRFSASSGWHYAPGPRLLVSQRVSVTGGRYYSRSLARVVLDEGKSLTAGWRADLSFVPTLAMVDRRRRERRAQPRRDCVAARRRPRARRRSCARTRRSTRHLAGAFAEARWSGPHASLVAAGGRVDHWTGSGDTHGVAMAARAGARWVRASSSSRAPASIDSFQASTRVDRPSRHAGSGAGAGLARRRRRVAAAWAR